MPRLAVVVAILAVVGCHSSKPKPDAVDASTGPGSVVTHAGPVAPARFSRPIAAARVLSGVTLVAGLVVPTGAIAVTAIGPDGATRWTHDAITGVTWSANATLNVFPARGGAVVVWRGLRGGQQGTVAAEVTLDGRATGEPYPVGAAACATDTELAWVDHGPRGTWLVNTRAFGAPAFATGLKLPEDRDPALLCGAKSVFVLGDGDDDVTVGTLTGTTRAASVRVVQEADFRGDEERGHEAYAVGDVLGLVRFGLSGSVAAREVLDQHPTAWRRFGRKLTESDDVTLVDADAHAAVVAFTHVAGSGADEAGGTVEAFAWERAGSREASYRLAPVDAARARGPFWSGAVPGGVVVAWAERSAHEEAGRAPIVGMAYRVVSLDALGEIHRVERAADELVDAGCDDAHCYAVALARAASEDGGQPEVAAVLAYP